MEAFVSGQDRSVRHVREMEGEFAQQLDQDERFEDLQYTLAMFGADGYDVEEQLVKECAWRSRRSAASASTATARPRLWKGRGSVPSTNLGEVGGVGAAPNQSLQQTGAAVSLSGVQRLSSGPGC